MNIPKTVKIGPLTYEVKVGDEVTEELEAYGSTSHTQQKIFISTRYPSDHQEETFLHELLHAVMNTCGLKTLIDNNKKLTVEEMIRIISPLLKQVIDENPEIFMLKVPHSKSEAKRIAILKGEDPARAVQYFEALAESNEDRKERIKEEARLKILAEMEKQNPSLKK